nr:immunoglobulin heavy chain junction region [Macaca mulatta]MOX95308.1 immunoglobulin heavy chain junction region [Macaca mulatta]
CARNVYGSGLDFW